MQFAKTEGDNEVIREVSERHFTDDVLRIITILQATGDKERAKNIQIDALKVLDNAAIRDAIKP